MADVSTLLQQSRAAHQQYRHAQAHQHTPDVIRYLREAHRLRQAAHEADPTHLDPAWSEPIGYAHDALVAFYARAVPAKAERLARASTSTAPTPPMRGAGGRGR